MAFLDNNGVGTLWGRIKTVFGASFADVVKDSTSVTIKLQNGYGNDLDTVAIPLADSTNSKAGLMSPTEKTKLAGIASGAEVNVQADWNQTTTTADDYIKNKPTIPTVPANIVNTITTKSGTHTPVENATGIVTFNIPTSASHVGAVPTSRTVNGKALSADINLYFADVKTSASDNTTLATALGNKVDKVTGKGLSTNDYTTADQTKVGYVDTGKSVTTYVSEQISSAMTGSAKYKGTVGTGGTVTDLPTSGYKQGDYYVVCTAGTYAGNTCEVGDMLFANKDYVTGANQKNDWDAVQANITAMTTEEINAICV